jgi:polynucleotide 5'-kinase involved in rRNA processing
VNEHEALAERAATANTVVMIGGLDSGKTTLSKMILRKALEGRRSCAFVDADVGQKTTGPPTTIGMKLIRGFDDIEHSHLARADEMYFVGATSPEGNLLPVVTGTSRLVTRARELGADFVIVDTSGLVSGLFGEMLKFHKFELIRPDMVVGLQRGEEMLPLLGIVQRFFQAEVIALGVHPDVVPTSADERAANRENAMRSYFGDSLQRWRVKPTVFMPSLPPLFDLVQLDRLLVGMADGDGATLGLGYLEHSPDEGVLRLVSPVAEGPKALRLGSVRLDENYRARRVDLRSLLGTD